MLFWLGAVLIIARAINQQKVCCFDVIEPWLLCN